MMKIIQLHTLSETVSLDITKLLTDWKPELGLWRSEDGDLAIHRAVSLKNFEHVRYLCNPEVISEPGANGQTPLHYAVIANDATMVKYLLEHGADVDRSNSHGNGPMLEALSKRNEVIAEILLDWGANVEATNGWNWRPLHCTATHGHTKLTNRLLNLGCELEPQNDEGKTPFFLACDNNYTEIINLFFARGIENVTIQASDGWTYAHVAASRGRQDVFEKLIQMDTSLIFKTNWAGFDPLYVAAYCGEPAVVEILVKNGASPDGPPHTQYITPLAVAAEVGCTTIVDVLLRFGAKVDKRAAVLRTPLMWAVVSGHVKTAHRLLKAGANPFLTDEMGFSAFDLAVGKPAMEAILMPWYMPSGQASNLQDSQIYLILQFISRTAKILARMVEQGADVRGRPGSLHDLPMIYLDALRYAMWSVVGAREAGQALVLGWARIGDLANSCLHAHPGDTRTAVPVKKTEIIREYRSLYSDPEERYYICDFCYVDLGRDFYVCSICGVHSCANCHLALSVLSLRERLEDFGRLRLLRTDVVAVLQALRPTSYQGAGIMLRILSQGALLQHWVFQKDLSYQKWRSSRTFYEHFGQEVELGWKAVRTLSSILSLSARSKKEVIDLDGTDSQQDEDMEGAWGELSEQWRGIFAFNDQVEDPIPICVHHCRQFVKISRDNENAVLDPSGRLAAEFFEFLANKYEAASNIGTSIIDFLESTRYPGNSSADLNVDKQSSIRSLSRLEHLAPFSENPKSHPDTHVDMTRKEGDTIVHPEHSSPQSSGSTFAKEDLEDDDGTATDLEDLLESLLVKRSCLIEEGRLTNEDDLVFNTAWNMAQAIVYQDMPRPTLNEIAEKGEGYYTAPSTPVSSNSAGHGGTTPSSYGTPRSMSPVPWILDLDEQPAAWEMEVPEIFSL